MLKPNRLVFTVIFLIIGSILGCIKKVNNTEQKQLFDLNWEFHQGDISSASAEYYNDQEWQDLDLPHDWTIDNKPVQSSSSEITDTIISEVGWYRKEFSIPTDWRRKRVSVYFEGVEMNPEVYINGSSLGLQPNGSSSFYRDITPFLDYSEKNIISVRVNNAGNTLNSQQQRAGIYSHVWLILTDTISFAR